MSAFEGKVDIGQILLPMQRITVTAPLALLTKRNIT
jgi:hypothetical protein